MPSGTAQEMLCTVCAQTKMQAFPLTCWKASSPLKTVNCQNNDLIEQTPQSLAQYSLAKT